MASANANITVCYVNFEIKGRRPDGDMPFYGGSYNPILWRSGYKPDPTVRIGNHCSSLRMK